MSKGGWLYIEDDVDRYKPDREVILDIYRKTEAIMLAKQEQLKQP